MQTRKIILSAFLTLVFPFSAVAGGYEILGHSTDGTGLSYAGAVSGYDDGSSAFYNPAAMSVHEKTTFQFGGHLVPLDYDFRNEGSTVSTLPNTGSDGNNDTYYGVLADMYIVHPVSESVTAGFVVTSPFGLGMDYADDYMPRYQISEETFKTIQFGPSIAVDLTDNFSVGAGVHALYADAQLKSAVDFGSIGYGLLGAQTASALGLAPQMNDGRSEVNADDWAVSWRAGASYRYGEKQRNRLGINYRGKTDLSLSGDIKYSLPAEAAVLNSTGAFNSSGASAHLELPEQIAFGGSHYLDDQFIFYWEAAWTNWSRFEELRISTTTGDAVTRERWRDTWRESIGLRYLANEKWDFSMGSILEHSPVRSEETRTPAIPLSDELGVSVGVGHNFSENLRVNAGYFHYFFIGESDTNTTGPTGDQLVGSWDNYVGIWSLGFVYKLDCVL